MLCGQITERGYPVSEVSKRLVVSAYSLYEWRKKFSSSNDKSSEEAEEIRWLKRELARVTEERDILKRRPRISPRMQSEIRVHRPASVEFSVRTMCRMLEVHPSGFYAWLKAPMSNRVREDKRHTDLLKKSWDESGKVYGCRKLHDDLLDQGETCCLNREARLARLSGIKAQIGYKHRPGIYDGKPSVVVNNTLDRQFNVKALDKAWVTDITYIRTQEEFT